MMAHLSAPATGRLFSSHPEAAPTRDLALGGKERCRSSRKSPSVMAPGAEESVGVLPSYDQSLFQFRSKWEGPWYYWPLRIKGPSVNVLRLLGHLGDLCSAAPDFSQVTQVILLSLSEDQLGAERTQVGELGWGGGGRRHMGSRSGCS